MIGVSVGAGGANIDCTEVCAFRSAGEAGNTLLCAIVGFRSAIGGEFYILVVVEIDHILVFIFLNGDRLGFSAHRRVAINGYRLQIFNLFADIRRSCSRIMYWRGSAIPVVIHRVGSGGWDPLCLKGNIAIRHGKLAVFDGYAGFPASKFVAFSGRIRLYGVGVAFVHIVHEGVFTRPAATIQIISHLMFFHISAVEGDIVLPQLVIRLECDLVSAEITMQIPAAESILFAFVQFGRLNRRHICFRHRRVGIVVLCRAYLNRSGLVYILHLKVDHNYVFTCKLHITVKVLIRVCAVVSRDLCRHKFNLKHIVRLNIPSGVLIGLCFPFSKDSIPCC